MSWGNNTTTFNERLNFHLLTIDCAERAIIYCIGMMWPISAVLELVWRIIFPFPSAACPLSVVWWREIAPSYSMRGEVGEKTPAARVHVTGATSEDRVGAPQTGLDESPFRSFVQSPCRPHYIATGHGHRSVVLKIPPLRQWQSNSVQWILLVPSPRPIPAK